MVEKRQYLISLFTKYFFTITRAYFLITTFYFYLGNKKLN